MDKLIALLVLLLAIPAMAQITRDIRDPTKYRVNRTVQDTISLKDRRIELKRLEAKKQRFVDAANNLTPEIDAIKLEIAEAEAKGVIDEAPVLQVDGTQ